MSVQSEITRLSGNVSAALVAIAAKGVSVGSDATSDDLAALISSIEAGGGGGYIVEQVIYIPADTISVDPGTSFELCSTNVTTPYVLMLTRMNGASKYGGDYVAHAYYEVAMLACVDPITFDQNGVVSRVYHSSSSNFSSKSVYHYESSIGAFNTSTLRYDTLFIDDGKLFVSAINRMVLGAGATFMLTIVGE